MQMAPKLAQPATIAKFFWTK